MAYDKDTSRNTGRTSSQGTTGPADMTGSSTGSRGAGQAANTNIPSGSAGGTYNIDPVEEENYWRENFRSRPYASQGTYEDYAPAYIYGTETYARYSGRTYNELEESELRSGWEKFKDKSQLTWERAKDAVRDAYNRVFERESRRGGQTRRAGSQS